MISTTVNTKKLNLIHKKFLMRYFPEFLNKKHENFLSFVANYNIIAFNKGEKTVKDIFHDFYAQYVKDGNEKYYSIYSLGLNNKMLPEEHNIQDSDITLVKSIYDINKINNISKGYKGNNENSIIHLSFLNDDFEVINVIAMSARQDMSFHLDTAFELVSDFLGVENEIICEEKDEDGMIIKINEHFTVNGTSNQLRNFLVNQVEEKYNKIKENYIKKALNMIPNIMLSEEDDEDYHFKTKYFTFKDNTVAQDIELMKIPEYKINPYDHRDNLINIATYINKKINEDTEPYLKEEFNKVKKSSIQFVDFNKKNNKKYRIDVNI